MTFTEYAGAADGPPPSAASASAASAATTPPLGWITLAAGDRQRERPYVSTRRIAVQVTVAALAVVTLVGSGGALVSRRVAERQSVHDAAELTDVLAQSVIQPVLTDAMIADPIAARRVLDPLVRNGVLSAALVRVKLWTPQGTVLYSDEPRLIGRTFGLEAEARTALRVPQTSAGISDLSRPENQFERSDGTLLEVYRPVWTAGGHPLLFETYFRYDIVRQRSSGLWRGFVGVILSSLAALLVLLLPIVWSLLRRTRRAQHQRQALMQRAVDASEQERRRIAASLHDGVVQQLAAASFDIAGRAQQARRAGDSYADELTDAAATIRTTIGGLRSLLVDIYPPSLATAGLPAALRDLVSTMAGAAAEIVLDVDDALVGIAVPAETIEAIFRVAQETLRNAVAHAEAHTINLRMRARPGVLELAIDDDGIGFDADGPGPTGHFGLALITDAARRCGGRLRLASAAGRGTHYQLEVAIP